MDAVIDLAASAPEHKDLMNDRLSRLRRERREIESRLRDIEHGPVRVKNPDEIVDSILQGLADARRLFDQGTMEERKRVVRTFVDGLTVVGSKRSGEIRMKKLPMPESLGTGSSVESLAGVRCEAGQRHLAHDIELVVSVFEARGTALVPSRGQVALRPKFAIH